MRQVAFWREFDTVLDIENSRIYEVLRVEKRKTGVWITLKNVITHSTFSAYENSFLKEESYIGYRKEHEVQI